MIYKYEIACKKAGMNEEQIQEIRKFFDCSKKRLKRESKAREQSGFAFLSIHELEENIKGSKSSWDVETFDIPDSDYDVEEEIIHKMELEYLGVLMRELTEEDRSFLYECYADPMLSDIQLAKKMGIPRTTLQSRRERLLKLLRRKF